MALVGIFDDLTAEGDFSIVATHVRQCQSERNYFLQDSQRLGAIIAKWRFEPKADPLSRCGYDYQMVIKSGDVVINVSICFACNTLVLNHKEKFAVRRKQIEKLFAEDFEPMN